MTDLPLDPIAIDVGHLLHRTVTSLYAHLVTRPTGRAVRMAIESAARGDGGALAVPHRPLRGHRARLLLRRRGGREARSGTTRWRSTRRRSSSSAACTSRTATRSRSCWSGRRWPPWRRPGRGGSSCSARAPRRRTPPGGQSRSAAWWGATTWRRRWPSPALRDALERLVQRRLVYRSPITGRVHALSRLVAHLCRPPRTAAHGHPRRLAPCATGAYLAVASAFTLTSLRHVRPRRHPPPRPLHPRDPRRGGAPPSRRPGGPADRPERDVLLGQARRRRAAVQPLRQQSEPGASGPEARRPGGDRGSGPAGERHGGHRDGAARAHARRRPHRGVFTAVRCDARPPARRAPAARRSDHVRRPGTQGGWEAALRPETRVVMLETPTNPTLRILDPRPIVGARTRQGDPRRDGRHLRVAGQPPARRAGRGRRDPQRHEVPGRPLRPDRRCRRRPEGDHRRSGPGVPPVRTGDGPARRLAAGPRVAHAGGARAAPQRERAGAGALAREANPRWRARSIPDWRAIRTTAWPKSSWTGTGGCSAWCCAGAGAAADRFLAALRLALAAPSLGGVETLVSQPRYTSHVGLTPDEREAHGISDGFVRISVGVENVQDLQADFARALEATSPT